VVDLTRETVVQPGRLFTAAREVAGLFAEQRFKGAVDTTIVAGEVVFHAGEVTGKPGHGRFVPGRGAARS
jgi:dihydroorotase-like cyclic amidohydrolase